MDRPALTIAPTHPAETEPSADEGHRMIVAFMGIKHRDARDGLIALAEILSRNHRRGGVPD